MYLAALARQISKLSWVYLLYVNWFVHMQSLAMEIHTRIRASKAKEPISPDSGRATYNGYNETTTVTATFTMCAFTFIGIDTVGTISMGFLQLSHVRWILSLHLPLFVHLVTKRERFLHRMKIKSLRSIHISYKRLSNIHILHISTRRGWPPMVFAAPCSRGQTNLEMLSLSVWNIFNWIHSRW